jgi:hypothetical protein
MHKLSISHQATNKTLYVNLIGQTNDTTNSTKNIVIVKNIVKNIVIFLIMRFAYVRFEANLLNVNI